MSNILLGIIYMDFFLIGYNFFIGGPFWFTAIIIIICLIKMKLLEVLLNERK